MQRTETIRSDLKTVDALHDEAASPDRWSITSALLIVALALISWELIVAWRDVPVYILPAPSLVVLTIVRHPEVYATAAIVTGSEALGGLALGLAAGILVAVLITFWKQLESGVLALAILIKATPMVAIAPLLMIWFGFGPAPKVIITALITFFPILINVHSGLHAADEAILELFHSLHANRWETFRYVRWPSAWPYLFVALKITAPLSLIGAVVAEWAGASAGLGRTMWLAYTNLNLPSLFAAVFCLAIMGVTLYGLTVAAEKRVIFWRAEL